MTRGSKIWLAVAIAFTLINAGGAAYAFAGGEAIHTLVHLVGTAIGGLGTWLIVARARRRRTAFAAPSDERLEYLQQSVDAIALQVERIGEAQRFNQKVLEQTFRPSPGEHPR